MMHKTVSVCMVISLMTLRMKYTPDVILRQAHSNIKVHVKYSLNPTLL
jgi:hypothetical protein